MNDENTIEQRHSGRHKSGALPAGTAAPDFNVDQTPPTDPQAIAPQGRIPTSQRHGNPVHFEWTASTAHVVPVGMGLEAVMALMRMYSWGLGMWTVVRLLRSL